ncbi:Pectin lyase fold/virulence factor [Pseudocohnilembus persalinus]|uniref:Pectin lyase fold/virulence factor n=1 Tax=Pseudocohnilembus persalinus TaxID=266149 RepID=A0A0V0R6D2_PSEPJ|nr:Pectin lyase fold/virulence factor [Pseudocohnilembus persalinus]|eukprot:KRX10035.1 Pectin lyase fold/virulence factor [Pseudocohnilembus persalinus]
MTMEYCNFNGNQGNEGAAISINDSENIVIQNSKFQNQTSQGNGGAIYAKNVNGTNSLINITFFGNLAQNSGLGGCFYYFNAENLLLENILGQYNEADADGSCGYISKNSNYLLLKNITNEFNHATYQGGYYFYNIINAEIQNCKFINNTVGEDAPGFKIEIGQNVIINNTIVSNNQGVDWGGGMITKFVNKLFIYNTLIKENQSTNKGGGYYMYGEAQDVYIKNLTIKDNYAPNFAGGFYAEYQSNFFIEDLIIENNESGNGGGIYFESMNSVTFINTRIFNNIANQQGGGIYINTGKDIKFQNVNISENNASEGGAIKLQKLEDLKLISSKINKNLAFSIGGAVSITTSKNLEFDSSEFNQNKAQYDGIAFNIDNSQYILFNNSQILNSKNVDIGAAINSMDDTNIQIINTVIQDTNQGAIKGLRSEYMYILNSQIQNNIGGLKGGGLYLIQSNNFFCKNVNIQNNKVVQNGGGIYFEKSRNLTVQYSYIKNNQAINGNGGGFNFDISDDIYIQYSQISENYAKNYGGGIYSQNLITENFNIYKTNINYNEAVYGGGFYSDSSDFIELKNSDIKNNLSYFFGGGIFFKNANQFQANQCIFQNNSAISEFQSNESKEEFGQIYSKGGGIYLQNVETVIIKNSQFLVQYADKYGGALYIQNSDDIKIQNSQFNKNNVIFKEGMSQFQKLGDHFLSNGGAIYITNKKSNTKILIKENQFTKNQASSGGAILIDHGAKYDIDLQVKDLRFEKNIADLGPSIRLLIGERYKEIVKNFENIKNIDNVSELNQNQDYQFEYFQNEQRLSQNDYSFKLCQVNFYLPEGGKTKCENCYENGVCEGGYSSIYPKQKYWRDLNSESEEIKYYHCSKFPDRCLGNDTCLTAYTGVLCESCDIIQDFRKNYQGCSKCYSNFQVVIFTILVYSFTIFLVAFTVFGIKYRVNNLLIEKFLKGLSYPAKIVNQRNTVIKIMVMHFQILLLIDSLNIDFPVFISIGTTSVGSPTSSLSRVIACLFKKTLAVLISNVVDKESSLGDQLVQGVLLIYAILLIFNKPYKIQAHNQLSILSISVLILSINLSQNVNDSSDIFKSFLWVIIIFMHVVLFYYVGVLLYQESKFIIRQKILYYFSKNQCAKYFEKQINLEKQAKNRWVQLQEAFKLIRQQNKNKKINKLEAILKKSYDSCIFNSSLIKRRETRAKEQSLCPIIKQGQNNKIPNRSNEFSQSNLKPCDVLFYNQLQSTDTLKIRQNSMALLNTKKSGTLRGSIEQYKKFSEKILNKYDQNDKDGFEKENEMIYEKIEFNNENTNQDQGKAFQNEEEVEIKDNKNIQQQNDKQQIQIPQFENQFTLQNNDEVDLGEENIVNDSENYYEIQNASEHSVNIYSQNQSRLANKEEKSIGFKFISELSQLDLQQQIQLQSKKQSQINDQFIRTHSKNYKPKIINNIKNVDDIDLDQYEEKDFSFQKDEDPCDDKSCGYLQNQQQKKIKKQKKDQILNEKNNKYHNLSQQIETQTDQNLNIFQYNNSFLQNDSKIRQIFTEYIQDNNIDMIKNNDTNYISFNSQYLQDLQQKNKNFNNNMNNNLYVQTNQEQQNNNQILNLNQISSRQKYQQQDSEQIQKSATFRSISDMHQNSSNTYRSNSLNNDNSALNTKQERKFSQNDFFQGSQNCSKNKNYMFISQQEEQDIQQKLSDNKQILSNILCISDKSQQQNMENDVTNVNNKHIKFLSQFSNYKQEEPSKMGFNNLQQNNESQCLQRQDQKSVIGLNSQNESYAQKYQQKIKRDKKSKENIKPYQNNNNISLFQNQIDKITDLSKIKLKQLQKKNMQTLESENLKSQIKEKGNNCEFSFKNSKYENKIDKIQKQDLKQFMNNNKKENQFKTNIRLI